MKIIIKPPGQGKTRDLVRIASENGYCVVTRDRREVFHHASNMEIEGPMALSFEDFLQADFSKGDIAGFAIDGIEHLLGLIAGSVPVRAVSMQCQRGDASYEGGMGENSRAKTMKPVRPAEVAKVKLEAMPPEVVEVFNELIVEKWDGSRACFKQDEVVKLLVERLDVESSVLFDRHYLDVEDIFREVGWVVRYDGPAYNETYPATFEFRKK